MSDGDEKNLVTRSAESCQVPIPTVTVPWKDVVEGRCYPSITEKELVRCLKLFLSKLNSHSLEHPPARSAESKITLCGWCLASSATLTSLDHSRTARVSKTQEVWTYLTFTPKMERVLKSRDSLVMPAFLPGSTAPGCCPHAALLFVGLSPCSNHRESVGITPLPLPPCQPGHLSFCTPLSPWLSTVWINYFHFQSLKL